MIHIHPKLAALEKSLQPSPLTRIKTVWLEKQGVELWIKRDDSIHPIISGNKWRKLKYSLNHALSINSDTVISMGGAWSNHLHALAFIGEQLGIKTIGYLRGELPKTLSPTLQDIINWKMQIIPISREQYQSLRHYKHWQSLPEIQNHQYWLPEGGSVNLALAGVAELCAEITIPYDYLCVACGTGTTLAGLLSDNQAAKKVIGFSALKNGSFLAHEVNDLVSSQQVVQHWEINTAYHFGGFAKNSPELIAFMNGFKQETAITLEHVYTGKMFYGIYDLINKGYFQRGDRIIAIHTGGLQGGRPL